MVCQDSGKMALKVFFSPEFRRLYEEILSTTSVVIVVKLKEPKYKKKSEHLFSPCTDLKNETIKTNNQSVSNY